MMKRKHVKRYGLSVAGWVGAMLVFLLIRFVGLRSVPQFEGLDFSQIDHGVLFVESVVLGWILGSVFYLLDVALDRPAIRRRPYGALILIQTAGNLGLVVLALVGVSLFEMFRSGQGFQWSMLAGRLCSANFLVGLVFVTVVSFIFSFLKQVDGKFGPGNLWKLVIGMYHHPREEERIFMFLDLQASTTHAERLGHLKFSRFIQDCFIDLSVVIDHEAQIYQYVGDEVILFWDVDEGLHDANCIRSYYRFVDRLRTRDEHYRTEYGVVPVFKAGVNIGSATVLEVGEIKREISYLGDVLNTAARIQGMCGEFGENLLVSEDLRERLGEFPEDLSTKGIGHIELRGREQAVKIFSVHRESA